MLLMDSDTDAALLCRFEVDITKKLKRAGQMDGKVAESPPQPSEFCEVLARSALTVDPRRHRQDKHRRLAVEGGGQGGQVVCGDACDIQKPLA